MSSQTNLVIVKNDYSISSGWMLNYQSSNLFTLDPVRDSLSIVLVILEYGRLNLYQIVSCR